MNLYIYYLIILLLKNLKNIIINYKKMKCSRFTITLTSIIIILISYIIYNIFYILHTNPPPENMPKFSCQKVNYTFPMEDFVKVDDNTLIAGGANTEDMLNFNPNKKRDKGTLVLFDIRKKQLKNLELKNFPKNLHFFPHGMELYKNKYIYVINHGFNSIDGERFEIFEIVKEKNEVKYLNYIRSIKLPEEFHTATNGLAVAGEDDIFFY